MQLIDNISHKWYALFDMHSNTTWPCGMCLLTMWYAFRNHTKGKNFIKTMTKKKKTK